MAIKGYEANDSKFSSPLPAIGLDIAGATLVCLTLMLCDICLAIRQRKSWIPCRFFAINSFTLTLLSIATKLPVDLTTSMPSACDQLSKLCGTALLCISIGFFRPYIVGVDESEIFANLASLTVIVVTVAVNISLQISTGAIYLFKVEHVLTLVLMLLLLSVTGCFRSTLPECLCDPFRKSIKHMPRNVYTLKRCYMFSYITNPQLMHYRQSPSATVGMLCAICCVVLLQAAVRAYNLDQGVRQASNYKWSIWAVVGLQILTIIVGTFSVVLRSLTLASQMHSFLYDAINKRRILELFTTFSLVLRNWSLYSGLLNNNLRAIFHIYRTSEHVHNSLLYLTRIWVECVNELILITIRVAGDWFARAMRKIGISKCNRGDDGDAETMVMLKKEFDGELFERTGASPVPNFFSDYLLGKSMMDMETCIKKHSTYPMHSLLTFLERSGHGSVELLKQISQDSDELLLLVCLVRMADLLMPSFRIASMTSALDQAFEIIVFIHEKTKILTASNYMKINAAKDIWMSRGIKNHWFQTDTIRLVKNRSSTHPFWDQVRGVVEIHNIINIIGEPRIFEIISSTNECTEELYDRMEQLFVELLHYFINQLPDAIFNGLGEGVPAAQFEKNVQISMKLVARLNLLESVELSHFNSNNIKSYMTTDAAENDNESGSKDSLV